MPLLIVILFDLLLLNGLYALGCVCGSLPEHLHCWFLWNVSYAVGFLAYPSLAQNRIARVEAVLNRVFKTSLLMFLIFALYLWVDKGVQIRSAWQMALFGVVLFLVMFGGRLSSRWLLKNLRTFGRNTRTVVFVGAGHNLAFLYRCLRDASTGYRFVGYFDTHVSDYLPSEATLLGDPSEAISWLEKHRVHQVYCNLPSHESQQIVELINYCEKHFIRFYSVPNVRNYVHRAMEVEMIADMPVLSLRREPLRQTHNRILKRAFDLAVSTFFIVFFFWWIYLIVAIITKITMPGPVLFQQKRNGLLGEEFTCLKFRSMKVNKEADKLQATKNDPRKTKWGNIMRKTSIDELPQFLNVFTGKMSIVGPRPHMVRHTEEYSALIDKYMVRHWVKPGITGWAQVRGARGETQHLWQMEDRIKKDIWYIEHWSLWLDIKIIFYTVWNALGGDKQAY